MTRRSFLAILAGLPLVGRLFAEKGKPQRIMTALDFGGSRPSVFLWSAALTDAEIRAVADGARPWTIRPDSYVGER